MRAVCFSELPARLDLPSIHSGYWDPFFDVCAATEMVVSMHIGTGGFPMLAADGPNGPGRGQGRSHRLGGVSAR